MSNDHQLGDAPIETAYKQQMEWLARWIDQRVNGDKAGTLEREFGFVLMMFKFGDEPGRCNYISNAQRQDVVKLLKEQLARFEGQPV